MAYWYDAVRNKSSVYVLNYFTCVHTTHDFQSKVYNLGAI